MEESGVKWRIERFYRWRRNLWRAKPPIPKPSKPLYPAYGAALYTKYGGLSNLFILNTALKMPRKCRKM